jgi:hypothetical protein
MMTDRVGLRSGSDVGHDDPIARLRVSGAISHLPFEAASASLFFQLVASRYETGSIVLTSNLVFSKAHMFARTCVR